MVVATVVTCCDFYSSFFLPFFLSSPLRRFPQYHHCRLEKSNSNSTVPLHYYGAVSCCCSHLVLANDLTGFASSSWLFVVSGWKGEEEKRRGEEEEGWTLKNWWERDS